MSGSRRRARIGLVVIMTLAACSSDHAASRIASPFDPPPTIAPIAPNADEEAAGPHEPSMLEHGDATPGRSADGTVSPDDTAAPTSVAPVTVAPSTTDGTARWAAFDSALSSRLIGSGDYAVGVAVAVDGQIVHAADFGYRVPPPLVAVPASSPSTVATDSTTTTTIAPGPPVEPIEPGDRFRIASISKVITAIVVLQLVEGGQLGLDQPIGQRLADIVGATVSDPQVATITVRQLLSHTSGLASYQSTFFRARVDSCPAAGRYGLSQGLSAAPGTTYTYSNLNYCLLGLLVEDVAGRPYEAVVNDRLLAPLGIAGMRMATTYDADPGQVVHPSAPSRNYMEVLGAAGAWVATPSDLVTILASLDLADPGFHPLSQGIIDLMRTSLVTPSHPDPSRGYGLGMMVFGGGAYGHTGTVENTHAMVVDRADGVTWSVLVSGEYPANTANLAAIFDQAVADASITFR